MFPITNIARLLLKTTGRNINQIGSFKVRIPVKRFSLNSVLSQYDKEHDEIDALIDDEQHKDLSNLILQVPYSGHKVLVIQPKVKWGPDRKTARMAQLQLEESVTLAETLGWFVTGTIVVPVHDEKTVKIFGPGSIENIKDDLENTRGQRPSAVFISTNMLNGLQYRAMVQEFKLAVYDRYSIVLQIFLEHARSKESRIQVALAEIPYLRSRLKFAHETGEHSRESGRLNSRGGSGETHLNRKKRLLLEREVKLRKILAKIKEKRQLLRKNRKNKDIPVVAVIGYTNAGKTALIKSITDDPSMEPKDQLFATLDVTTHSSKLLNFQKALFVDTVGFISDIPVDLIESFSATLEDATQADLIVHIWDASHPDAEAQRDTVWKTLRQLNLSEKLYDTMIETANKVDLLENADEFVANGDCFAISAKTGYGVGKLSQEIQRRLTSNKGLLYCRVRVPNGGEESSWLYKFSSVAHCEVDEDANYMLFDCIMNKAILSKFKHEYGDNLILSE